MSIISTLSERFIPVVIENQRYKKILFFILVFICWALLTYIIGFVCKISSLSVLGLEGVFTGSFGSASVLSFTDTTPRYFVTGIYFYWGTIFSSLITFTQIKLNISLHFAVVLISIAYAVSLKLKPKPTISKLRTLLLLLDLFLLTLLHLYCARYILAITNEDLPILFLGNGPFPSSVERLNDDTVFYGRLVSAQIITFIIIAKMGLMDKAYYVKRWAGIILIIAAIECIMLPICFGKLLLPLSYPWVEVSLKNPALNERLKLTERPIFLLSKNDRELVLYNPNMRTVAIIKQEDVSTILIINNEDLRRILIR
jgi:hypothetical protein